MVDYIRTRLDRSLPRQKQQRTHQHPKSFLNQTASLAMIKTQDDETPTDTDSEDDFVEEDYDVWPSKTILDSSCAYFDGYRVCHGSVLNTTSAGRALSTGFNNASNMGVHSYISGETLGEFTKQRNPESFAETY